MHLKIQVLMILSYCCSKDPESTLNVEFPGQKHSHPSRFDRADADL
jgi:hypothetical protein